MKAIIFITPSFIEPEWYFLPYYAILRAIPHKLIGTICLCFALILILLFILNNEVINFNLFIFKLKIYWFFNFLFILGLLAICPLIYPFNVYCLFFAVFFMLFLFNY